MMTWNVGVAVADIVGLQSETRVHAGVSALLTEFKLLATEFWEVGVGIADVVGVQPETVVHVGVSAIPPTRVQAAQLHVQVERAIVIGLVSLAFGMAVYEQL